MSPALAGRFLTTGPLCMPNQTGGGGHLIPGWPVHGMVHICFRMVSQALRWFQHSELRNTKTKRESGVGSEPGCGGSSCGRRVQGAVLSGQRPEREVPAEVGEKLARPLGGREMALGPRSSQALNVSHHKLPVCGWVIFYCAYVPQLLYPYPSIHHWTSRLLPCPGCCKQCSSEHWGAYVFEKCDFSQDMCPVVGLLGHMVVLFLRSKFESVLMKKMNPDLVIQSDASQKVKKPNILY